MALIADRLGMLATGFGALLLASWGYRLLSNLAFFLRPTGIRRYLSPQPKAEPRDQTTRRTNAAQAVATMRRRAYGVDLAQSG